ARRLATDLQPVTSPEDVANLRMDLNDMLLSQGVTTASDMGEFLDYDEDTIFRLAAERNFKIRIAGYTMWKLAKKKKDFTTPPTTLQASGIFHKQGIKIIGDGSISGQTAWSYEPYLHSDSCGLQVDSDEDIQNALAFCRAHHCQLSIHAMGTRTLDNALSLVAGTSPWLDPAIPSIRMEHTTEPSAEAIRQAAREGIAFVTQPVFQYAEIETYLENIGAERTRRAYPIADFLDAGLRFAFSTDAPATSWAFPSDPMVTLKAAVTRRSYNGIDCGQRHRVDLETAIRLYTAESAPMLGFTDVGKIRAGYHADFLILDRDIFSMDPSDIDQVSVQQTFVDGVLSYEKTV
ncbi:MAG: amidohydrolase family protein, partial [Lachnospiraceae bacterium]|nr:amidohydrolase family protein [Lachnospiraceae bacterium]